ncbi:hypothetical protein C8Q70DRAFT_372912 [Cubamyces menziesii]|nr:hypothetical protein C8Q70DRAFT_372912 [Cubamyces menziesii]
MDGWTDEVCVVAGRMSLLERVEETTYRGPFPLLVKSRPAGVRRLLSAHLFQGPAYPCLLGPDLASRRPGVPYWPSTTQGPPKDQPPRSSHTQAHSAASRASTSEPDRQTLIAVQCQTGPSAQRICPRHEPASHPSPAAHLPSSVARRSSPGVQARPEEAQGMHESNTHSALFWRPDSCALCFVLTQHGRVLSLDWAGSRACGCHLKVWFGHA